MDLLIVVAQFATVMMKAVCEAIKLYRTIICGRSRDGGS
jgi:hypothetical protein